MVGGRLTVGTAAVLLALASLASTGYTASSGSVVARPQDYGLLPWRAATCTARSSGLFLKTKPDIRRSCSLPRAVAWLSAQKRQQQSMR